MFKRSDLFFQDGVELKPFGLGVNVLSQGLSLPLGSQVDTLQGKPQLVEKTIKWSKNVLSITCAQDHLSI